MLIDIGGAIAAIVVLWLSADWVVASACRVAHRFNLSDVVIGATVVALGTSAPEMVVTIIAALTNQPDISVGNVVGSNIFNIGFIMGGCAVLWPIPTTRPLVLRDTLALFVASIALFALLWDLDLGRWEGLAMMLCLVTYVVYMVQRTDVAGAEEIPAGAATLRDYVLLAIGLAGVIGGAHLLVHSSTSIARALGVSEWAIGVTIVAGGTSLPELVTSIAAARRGRPGLVAGNLVGSDLFNMLGILGLAGFLHPLRIAQEATWSVLMMVAMVGVLGVFMRTGWRLGRTEGVLLLVLAAARWTADLAPGLASRLTP